MAVLAVYTHLTAGCWHAKIAAKAAPAACLACRQVRRMPDYIELKRMHREQLLTCTTACTQMDQMPVFSTWRLWLNHHR